MRIKKALLINSPLSGAAHKSGHGGCFPHLGILQIGTSIKRFMPQVEKVRCIDGSITCEQDILREIGKECDSSTIVGISTLAPTHDAAVSIAEAAKMKGAVVIMGNDHATFFCEQILRNRDCVDFVALGESGVETMLGLIRHLDGAMPLFGVPNIGYRKGGSIVLAPLDPGRCGKWNYLYHRKLETFPMVSSCPDLSLIEQPQLYVRNYNEQYGRLHSKEAKAITVQFGKGCGWGGKGQGGDSKHICSYCAIADLKPDSIGVTRAISWMKKLRDSGYSVLYEVCDDLSGLIPKTDGGKPFLEELAKQKIASGLGDVELFAYCRASALTNRQGILSTLKKLNVKVVNIGMDSGSAAMLSSMTKGASKGLLEINERAIENLAEAGIKAYISFVLGAAGESEETLQDTILFAQKMLSFGNVVAIDPSPLLPLPGAVAWEQLRQAYGGRFEKEFERDDVLDTERLARVWADRMCKVPYDLIVQAIKRIRELGELSGAVLGGFGVKGNV